MKLTGKPVVMGQTPFVSEDEKAKTSLVIAIKDEIDCLDELISRETNPIPRMMISIQRESLNRIFKRWTENKKYTFKERVK